MAVSGICGRLHDDVGCYVEGVSGCVDEVKQAAAVSWTIDERIPRHGNQR